jgi:hypothetical protein
MFAASKSGKPAGAVTDPYFNSTTLLLETTGTNGQQNNTFLDSSTNNFTITRTGTPTQGTFTPFSQTGWSGYFGGTSNYLTAPTNAAFAFGTGDFTVECWVFDTGTTAAFAQIVGASTYGVSNEFIISLNGSTRKLYAQLGNPAGSNSTGDITANVWTHVAVVRSGATLTFYINGIASGSSTNSNSVSSTIVVTIGASNNNNSDSRFVGYISNARVVKGTAVYTANFTPSTTPLTAVSGTSLLTLQSNCFKDNSSNNFAITATGTPSIQAFSPFAPAAAYSTATVGGSGYFNGTSQSLTVTTSTPLDFGTGNFTLEFWMYPTSITSQMNVLSTGGSFQTGATRLGKDGVFGMSLYTRTGVDNVLVSEGNNTFINGAANTWTHYAVVRNGTTFTLYRNGVSVGTGTSSVAVSLTLGGSTVVGTDWANDWWPGYLSNVRVVNGTALYTANFTPPTAPLTAVTNTSLLLNATNAGIYDATAKNDVTTVSNAQVSTAQSQFGGSSMLFNGTTDYLTTVDKPIAQLGTGNFTIEMWVYPASSISLQIFIRKGAGADGFLFQTRSSGASNTLSFWISNGASPICEGGSLTLNAWQHLAVVRSSGTITIYKNGTSVASAANSTNFIASGAAVTVGTDTTNYLNGYMDDLRITKGIARYTANFTPPTAPFPVS